MAALNRSLQHDYDDAPLGWACSDHLTRRIEGILDRLCGPEPDGRVLLPLRSPLLALLDPDSECRPPVADVFSRDFLRNWIWPLDGEESPLDRIDELLGRSEDNRFYAHNHADLDSIDTEQAWEVELEDWCGDSWDEDTSALEIA